MTARPANGRERCPRCGKYLAKTKSGNLRTHFNTEGRRCLPRAGDK